MGEVNYLLACPVNFAEAAEFVTDHHRHHRKPQGMKFCFGVKQDSILVGVIIAARPVARMLDNGLTLEVTRCCVVEGSKNANSFLYSRVAVIAKAMGYKRLITYTLPSEGGSSLRAAGWKDMGEAGGGSWSRPSRDRTATESHPLDKKVRWQLEF